MRVHLPGLPHTETTRDWATCAYTQKIGRLAEMLVARGHKVFLYGGERNDFTCTEHVVVATAGDRYRWFGDELWRDRVFNRWEPDDVCWTEFNTAAAQAIAERVEPGDLLALPMGRAHKQIADAHPGLRCFESGIGYEGTCADFRVYESYAWMHYLWGQQRITDGRWFDTVIPNAFDPADHGFRAAKDDYLLFLGRHTPRKGLDVVAELAKHHRVVTAGQPDVAIPGTEYVGVVAGIEKAELLAGARALLAPTIYIEPFGGVAVEAQMSGTPVLTVPWGAFTETVEHEVTGFHCHTLGEFLAAVERCDELVPHFTRQRALDRYSVDVISHRYDHYLRLLATLDGEGWYTTRPLEGVPA